MHGNAAVTQPEGPRQIGGSRKGCPNKNTKALKDMILGALSKAGGEKYLLEQSRTNPNGFLALVGKVLPMTVTGEGTGGSIVVEIVKFAGDEGSN